MSYYNFTDSFDALDDLYDDCQSEIDMADFDAEWGHTIRSLKHEERLQADAGNWSD